MNKLMFFAGVLTFFLFFFPVHSYETSCCNHRYTQYMAVSDFIIGVPSCLGSTSMVLRWADIISPASKITALFFSLCWMVGSMRGWDVVP